MEGMLENNKGLSELKGKIVVIPDIDKTLTKDGYSADAKVVGEELEARIRKAEKPFGEYSGNGSEAPRTIKTGGIGSLLMLYCSTRISFVTPKGALVVDLTEGTTSWIDSSKVFYENGDLTLKNIDESFNESGITYYYQVI